MTLEQLATTLQLMDSLFPVGAFAYSDGLETAAANGHVRDGDSLSGWIDHYMYSVYKPCDGLAVLKCARAMTTRDWPAVHSIDEELTVLKSSAAVRASSKSVGKRLLKTYASICQDEAFAAGTETLPQGNAPVAYGLVLSHRGLNEREALVAFGYAKLSGIVSAGMRLVALGQQQGQLLLSRAVDRLPAVTEQILKMANEPLRSFSPMLDIHQMNHRYVYSRLFRS